MEQFLKCRENTFEFILTQIQQQMSDVVAKICIEYLYNDDCITFITSDLDIAYELCLNIIYYGKIYKINTIKLVDKIHYTKSQQQVKIDNKMLFFHDDYYENNADIITYDITNTTFHISHKKIDDIGFTVTSFNGKIFVIGGYDTYNYSYVDLHTVYYIENELNVEIEPMIYGRGKPSSIVIDNKIYVCGGNCDVDEVTGLVLGNIEYYEEGVGWTLCSGHMIYPRANHKMINIGNKLLIIGGRKLTSTDGNVRINWNIPCLRAVEIYDIKTQKFYKTGSLHVAYDHIVVMNINDSIICIGRDRKLRLQSMEKYNFETGCWSFLHDLPHSDQNYISEEVKKQMVNCDEIFSWRF